MKTRIFITLLLSAVLALPAFAQQTNSSSSAQPAASADQTAPPAQPVTATGREPLRARTPRGFWDGDEPGLAWLVLRPFASKDYVERDIQPIRDGLIELEERTAARRMLVKQ